MRYKKKEHFSLSHYYTRHHLYLIYLAHIGFNPKIKLYNCKV